MISGSQSSLTSDATPRIVTTVLDAVVARKVGGSAMGSRVAVGEKAVTAAVRTEDGIDPAFQRAILKVAIELKKPNAPSYDAIVAATIRSMKLDPVAFRRYLGENGAKNMSLLLATARTSGL
jgi:hypothetical protein